MTCKLLAGMFNFTKSKANQDIHTHPKDYKVSSV